jgi:T5SS/PEP-CTERM-associated repeat protein
MASFSVWRRRGLWATSVVALGAVLATTTPSRAVEFWNGSASTDWFSVGNWSAIVPTNSTSTRIDTVTPNATVVGAAGAQATGLRVGVSATGALTIQNGGTVNNTLGIIADNAGSSGTATVDGAGSRWTNSSDFYVGHGGSGTLTIRNGGAVSNVFGFIGNFSSATGAVTVDGPGSTWTNSADLNVGAYGSGTLTIRNGGAVSSDYGFIGYDSGATGVVTVDGAGSTWTNSSDLNIGAYGTATGTLTIRNGGAVSNGGNGFLGAASGSTGAATVDGAGSSWNNSGDLYVGNSGNGTLTIRNGGAVRNGFGFIGNVSGSTGAVTVDGAGSTWTNSGDLNVGGLGTGALTIQNGGTVRNTLGYIGVDSGSTGAVTVDGAGSTWTNSGDLNVGAFGTGTGTLTIRNGGGVAASTMSIANQAGSTGTLNIGAAAGQTAAAPGTLNTASVNFGNGTGQIVFNHTAANYIFAPAITSSGTGTGTVLVKAGTTILTATNTYTGPTVIDGGTLSVNGSIAQSAVTVNAGGTLGGNGTVGNTTINGGTLAPGNSIGLLTVNGSLSFTAASSYMVEVSPANADRVNVTGTATLSGAKVNAFFAAGSYVARQYTIVNAGGGVSGTFGSVVNSNLPSGFKSSLSYDGNNAYLNLTLAFVAPSNTGLNGNQTAVANALVNFFNRTGGIPLVFGGLTPAGLTRISGETAVGSQQTTFDAMTQFMGVMTDPFTAGRGFDAGAGATPFAEVGSASPDKSRSKSERDAYAAIYRKTPIRDAYDPRWSVWAAGFGGSQTTEGNAALGSNTATSRVFGVAAGADYLLSPRTIAGFALAGGGTNFSVANGGSGRSDLFQAGAFIKHNVGAAYVTAAAAYGWQNVTTDRTVTIAGVDRLRAQFNANALSGRIEGGNRYVTPWMGGLGLTPYAAAQVTNFDLPAYAESALAGATTFALSYAARSVTATRGELGLRSDKSFAMNDTILTLRGRAAWAHDINPDRALAATFQTLPGAGFIVNGAAPARDNALVTAAAEMKWLTGFSLAATFDGAFSNVTRSYAGKGVARYNW